MFPLISSITLKTLVLRVTGTQQQPPAAAAATANLTSNQPPHKQPAANSQPHPPSASLLSTVASKEVEEQFSVRGETS
jgi:hypothetical protein